MRVFGALLHEGCGQFSFGIAGEDFLDLARGDFRGGSVGGDINRNAFVRAAAHERQRLGEHATGVRAERALLNLRAWDALEREARRAQVVKHLDRVPVQGVDLVAQLQQGLHRVRVGFRRSILQRIDGERVVQFRDDKELTIGGHEVTIDPDHGKHSAKVCIRNLSQR